MEVCQILQVGIFECHGYRALVRWSDEDKCYIASVPALPGCMAHGETQQECAAMVADAILGWLEEARAAERPIPGASYPSK